MSCEHEHKFIYQGVVYWYRDYPLPGSGAYSRVYGDKYFCEKCLKTKILNEREHGNSYNASLPGTLPR